MNATANETQGGSKVARGEDLLKNAALSLLRDAEASLQAALETVRGAIDGTEASELPGDPVTNVEVKAATGARNAARQADVAAVAALAAAVQDDVAGLVDAEDACPHCGERRMDNLCWRDDGETVTCTSCGKACRPGCTG